MTTVERLTIKNADLEQINRLLTQQSPGDQDRNIGNEDLSEALLNPLFYLLAAIDNQEDKGEYIGMASIFFQRNLARWIAEIHDVVVDENYRGQGFGELLTKEVMNTALDFSRRENAKIKLYLTSRPSRVAANALYTKLGFVLVANSYGEWGTNLYKIIVEPQGFRGLPSAK